MTEQAIIKQSLNSMAQIINAIPGETYANKEAETLLIMQHRLPESDLKKQIEIYNAIFAKQGGASISDITDSAIAYVKIKVLSEAELLDFDAKSLRNLIKECRINIDKTTNILRLSKMHLLTADEFQKEKIEKTAKKNEAFISALEEVIAEVEKRIERMPKPLELPEREFGFADEDKEAKKPVQDKPIQPKASVTERIQKFISSGREKREMEERLKDVEKEDAETGCKEIPFYDKTLYATEVMPCKDFGCYSLLKRKDNVYFGLTKNLKEKVYDNKDQSLIELTEITEEFLQFMTADVLTEEYELHAFTEDEKIGMRMYFNFVSKSFEKHIGNTLTVSEYLAFKRYYNRLVREVMRLDEEKHRNYYRALPIAEEYMELMASYNMVLSESKREIVEGIIAGKSDAYLENLDLIIEHHIVDEEAKKDLLLLKERIVYFADEDHFCKPDKELEPDKAKPVQILPAGFIPQIPMYQQVGAPLIGNMYFTLQCLNENREVVDEAYFATANMPQAMEDYRNKEAYIKRFGLIQDGRFVPLLSSEGGSEHEE
ncbi:hypothetical protein SAMN05216470_1835 [Streptococcus equinus]|uniref:Uncharacterized protein n=1 Tax=Streptococcus equinus TaxID=1335 RepID=A0A239RF80_STREI|nr:hypothetical protein [Streptococcus equinus]MBQ3781955.1 hypothetical protein [Lachnospiraceae bacterium]SNU09487.1 hypothetical protein SAMN05216470_1835 [Streptococcus equinus]